MKRLLCFYFAFVFYSQLNAQFRDGYLITNNGDTITGLIDFKGSLINSRTCTFKKDLNDKEQIFTPEDLKAFRFLNSKYYVSMFLNIDGTNKKVFLEWLIKGQASILTYPYSINDIRYYLMQSNDSLIELKDTKYFLENKEYYNYSGDKTWHTTLFERQKREYIGLLNYYFRDADMQTEIINSKLNSSSLIKVAKDYHYKVCKDKDCEVFEDKQKSLNFSFGLNAFYSVSRLKLNVEYLEPNHQPDAGVAISKSFGYGASINISNLPFLSPKFSIQSGFDYYRVIFSYLFVYKMTQFCDFDLIRIPLQLRFTYPIKKLEPFISLGGSISIKSNKREVNPDFINYLTQGISYTSQDIADHQFGINSSIGCNYMVTDKFGISAFFDYELAFFLLGGMHDRSTNNNTFTHFGVFYRMK